MYHPCNKWKSQKNQPKALEICAQSKIIKKDAEDLLFESSIINFFLHICLIIA